VKINLKRIIPECHHFDPEVKRKTHLNIFLLHFKTEKKTDNFIKIQLHGWTFNWSFSKA